MNACRLLALLDRFAGRIALLTVLIATGRIIATYNVFSHTADEPRHFACGMYYWIGHMSPVEYAPFSRAMLAVGPFLAGARRHHIAPSEESMPRAGLDILYDNYSLYLTLARLGVLPFFWGACGVTYLWSRRYFGRPTAAVAVLLFSLIPPILAHSGLATTDMALTACLGAAFLCGVIWAQQHNWLNSAVFGGLAGLAVLSKFTACGFLPAALALALLAYLLVNRPGLRDLWCSVRKRTRTFCLAVCAAAFVVWAGYQFSLGWIPHVPFRVPAPVFFEAIRFGIQTNKNGLPSYLLGEFNETGWWYYYPVALAVKTPLPFLILLAGGVLLCVKTSRNAVVLFPLCFAAGILAMGSLSHINMGLRHILPVYIGFSIIVANVTVALLERAQTVKWIGWTLAALLGWLVWTGAAKHPDYLAYFNELVGKEPEKVLVDSDLDWGQDLNRVARRLHELGAKEVTFTSFIPADLEKQHGFPPVHPITTVQSPGWTAVSPTWWKLNRFELTLATGSAEFWLDEVKPSERVGSMLLYYLPAPL